MSQKVKKTKGKINANKGITLIALVITIIVLLILAGVAINMAINSNGLFGKANEAVHGWNTAVDIEKEALLKLETKFLELESNSDNEMVAYYIEEIPVPKGFKYVEGTKATGVVIKNTTDGNEFVWIAASAEQLESENENNLLYDETNYPKSYEMMSSIREYGGYYMARYAAGSDVEITEINQMEKLYSQNNKYKYKCGTFNQMISLCLGMYPDNDTNTTGVLSHYQLNGMTKADIFNTQIELEEMREIGEWYGCVDILNYDGFSLICLHHISYQEDKGDFVKGGYAGAAALETLLNEELFTKKAFSFRPVIYLKTSDN